MAVNSITGGTREPRLAGTCTGAGVAYASVGALHLGVCGVCPGGLREPGRTFNGFMGWMEGGGREREGREGGERRGGKTHMLHHMLYSHTPHHTTHPHITRHHTD